MAALWSSAIFDPEFHPKNGTFEGQYELWHIWGTYKRTCISAYSCRVSGPPNGPPAPQSMLEWVGKGSVSPRRGPTLKLGVRGGVGEV